MRYTHCSPQDPASAFTIHQQRHDDASLACAAYMGSWFGVCHSDYNLHVLLAFGHFGTSYCFVMEQCNTKQAERAQPELICRTSAMLKRAVHMCRLQGKSGCCWRERRPPGAALRAESERLLFAVPRQCCGRHAAPAGNTSFSISAHRHATDLAAMARVRGELGLLTHCTHRQSVFFAVSTVHNWIRAGCNTLTTGWGAALSVLGLCHILCALNCTRA